LGSVVPIGRRQELDRLLGLTREARAGDGSVVFLLGRAGSGRSPLLRAFAEVVRGDGDEHSELVQAACYETSAANPLGPFGEVLRALSPFDIGQATIVIDGHVLGVEDIGYAIEELSDCDVVIRPTTDGGYCLIGFSSPIPALLKGIEWGTPRVYPQTLDLMRSYQVQWKSLGIGSDVDTFEDLKEVWRIIEDSPRFINSDEGKDLYPVIRELVTRSL
jgi:energy-coupling factor transporter ATP-binding protein EcfA2